MTVKHNAIFFLLIVLSIAIGCKDKNEPEPTIQLIPGVGLVDLKIGDRMQKAIAIYGERNPTYTLSGDTIFHYLAYYTIGTIVYAEPTMDPVFTELMKIGHFAFAEPFAGKTDKQIGIGSTKTEVKAAYGEPDSSEASGDVYDIGITFIYDDLTGEKVEQIQVQ